MEMSNAVTVVAPRSPVVQEANPITLRFTVYGLGEATEVRLLWILWTSGRRNVEAICIVPDARRRRAHSQAKRDAYVTYG